MRTRHKETTHAELDRARRRFDRWRQTRKGRARIPETLWNLAVKVAPTCGLSKTATTLRVDYAGLKRRVEAAATVSDSRTPTENRFLELSPPQPPVQRQCVVQLEGSGGAKMRIELNGMETPDLLALSRGFWEVER